MKRKYLFLLSTLIFCSCSKLEDRQTTQERKLYSDNEIKFEYFLREDLEDWKSIELWKYNQDKKDTYIFFSYDSQTNIWLVNSYGLNKRPLKKQDISKESLEKIIEKLHN